MMQQTSAEDRRALDGILDAYHLFGSCIPSIEKFQDLIKERPQVVEYLAFMYLDLLRFHQKAVQLLKAEGKTNSKML